MAVSIYDSNLLLYYAFDSVPVSGTDIPNLAPNKPLIREDGSSVNTDLSWHSVWGASSPGTPGVHGLYGTEISSDIDPYIPPQWGDPPYYAASGHKTGGTAGTFVSYFHKLRNIDNWETTGIAGALASGDFTVGGWWKGSIRTSASLPTFVNFAGSTTSLLNGYYIAKRGTFDKEFYMEKHSPTVVANIFSDSPSGAASTADGFWHYWNHVAFTVSRTADGDGNYAYMFLNGEPVEASSDADWASEFTGANVPKYMAIGGSVYESAGAVRESPFAVRDFFFFDRALASGEIIDIFNNDFVNVPIITSEHNNLLLWYRFTEPSGVNVQSWAANTPTVDLGGNPIDTSLTWYDDIETGDKGIFSVDTQSAGHINPLQWANYWDPSYIAASGNTTTLYHALRGDNISFSKITDTLASGSYSVGCWFTYGLFSIDQKNFLFAFDRGSQDDLALGLNTYDEDTFRFAYSDGIGSNHYLYNNILPGSGFQWNHVMLVHTDGGDGEGKHGRFYINSKLGGTTTDSELDNLLGAYYLTFFNNHDEFIDNQFHGAVKDFVFFDKALSTNEVESVFNYGIDLITSEDSETIGGYALGRTRTSGIIGGYGDGFAYLASGVVGGYGLGYLPSSGLWGGYTFSAERSSGVYGGFIYASGIASGVIGGYNYCVQRNSGVWGGYNFGVLESSGIIGGFVNCGLAGSGVFDASFRVKALTYSDFDALIEVQSTFNSDFDAEIEVYKNERPPWVSIKYPDGIGFAEGHDVSGVLAPLLIWFVGSGVPVDSKTINKAIYNYGNGQLANAIPSGGDQYVSNYHYQSSGIYMATLNVLDSNGLTGSDSVKIHLASGVPMPDVELTATPTEGNAPLLVNFDFSITNIPNGVSIKSKKLFLGNGKSTANPNITYIYGEPGIFTPILVVTDSRNFVTCDSLRIGVNN